MPHDHADPDFVARQYRSSANLAARQRIYRFATPAIKWYEWVFDRMRLPAEARVLELGCGNAALWRANLHRIPEGWDITLSDLSSGMLEDARANLAEHTRRFHFARADAQAIHFPDQTFDAVIANHMLYHVPDRPRAYAEIVRVLKPSGTLFAATNGDDHVIEIRRLIERFVPTLGRGSFSLAGAGAELERFFTSVEVIHLRGELRVPQVEPILDYIRSMDLPEPLTDGQCGEIERILLGEIQEHGFVRVTTATGLSQATT